MSEEPNISTSPASEASVDPPVTETAAAATPASGEGCPTPLAWKQVRTEFLNQSEEFKFSEGGLSVGGRVFGKGTPLYFLNGISATSTIFCLTAWLLREEFRCVILDFPPEARTIDQLVQSLDSAATQFDDETFDLYATSFGSAVGLQCMRQHPQRIQRAILQGPLISMRLSVAERLALRTLGWLPGQIGRLPLRRAVLQNNHSRWFPPFDITRWQFLLNETGDVPTREVARRANMLRGLDLSDGLSEITTPSLIISSEGEAARHRLAAKTLGEQLPNATAEEISNSGHVPFVTHPHRLVKLIRPFLHPELHAESCAQQ